MDSDSIANALPNEYTSLIRREESRPRKSTPLRRLQISTPVLLRACDALATHSVTPYINQLVSELEITGGDQRKVGYYVGLIGSLYYGMLVITVFQWNRISDHIGRKPVVLIGLFGSTVSMISFGLSRTFWGLVASRCLWGLLDGNMGVVKSIVGEITDSSNQAKAFALTFVVWGIGATIASLIGGNLSRPGDRFPELFVGDLWKRYPYLLPCLTTAGLIFSHFLFTLFFFRESAPIKSRSAGISEETSLTKDEPVPLRQLFVYPVMISIANYTSLEFLAICHGSILPLFLAMPVEIGGLGFDPLRIGYIMGAYRAFITVFLGLFLDKSVRHFGERRLFVYVISAFLGVWPLFPTLSLCVKHFGVTMGVWIGIAVMALLMGIVEMGHGCIYMIVTAAAPNKRSLGATNGLSQTAVSVGRVVAPAMTTSMFSFSVQHGLLGGYAVYAVLFALSCFAISLAQRLLREPEDSGTRDVAVCTL